MSKTTWTIGARLHHVKFGFGTIVNVPNPGERWNADWLILRDIYSHERYKHSWASKNDRNGWHIVNSPYAKSCSQCREGKSEDNTE